MAPSRPPAPLGSGRLSSGVPGLDPLLGGGLIERSISLVSGSKGVGKTTLGLQYIAAGAAQGEPGLYVSLDNGPEQIAKSAAGFGLAWAGPSASGLIQCSYLSPTNVRASQFFSLLSDQICKQKTRRLVLDGAAYLTRANEPADELREMLLVLVSQFKLLGVTALLLLEADAMYATESMPERGFSSVADNLLLLRYELAEGELRPYLVVANARDSAHDRGAYGYSLDHRGIQVGPRVQPGRSAPWPPSKD